VPEYGAQFQSGGMKNEETIRPLFKIKLKPEIEGTKEKTNCCAI
jgi:hypothetical protein